MMLFVNGVSGGIYCNRVGYWVNDYESAFELLSQLVADNWILEEAVITDDNHRLRVPVEAFDGQPIHLHIRALQQQWNQLLVAKPIQKNATSKLDLKEWYLKLDTHYGLLLNHLEKMIFLLNAQKFSLAARRDEKLKHTAGRQNDSLLQKNRKMYLQTEEHRKKNLLRLYALQNRKETFY